MKLKEALNLENFLDFVKDKSREKEILPLIQEFFKENDYDLKVRKIKIKSSVVNSVPISIFNDRLGCLEAIVKHLKENIGLKNKDIALLLDRDARVIWQIYNSSIKKLEVKIEAIESRFSIPLSIIADKRLSVLESISLHLMKDYGLSYHKIALLLSRDDRTIWTVINRGLLKLDEK